MLPPISSIGTRIATLRKPTRGGLWNAYFYTTSCLQASTIGVHGDGTKILNCVKLGVLKMDQGNIKESVRYFLIACKNKNMAGCYWLGVFMKRARHFVEAKSFYTHSCTGGYEKACNALGLILEQHGDIRNARIIYRNTCDRGNLGGCHDLGMLENDQGNTQKSKQYLNEACSKGFKYSCEWVKKIHQKPKKSEKLVQKEYRVLNRNIASSNPSVYETAARNDCIKVLGVSSIEKGKKRPSKYVRVRACREYDRIKKNRLEYGIDSVYIPF